MPEETLIEKARREQREKLERSILETIKSQESRMQDLKKSYEDERDLFLTMSECGTIEAFKEKFDFNPQYSAWILKGKTIS